MTDELNSLADAGLLEYSRDTGKVYPTKLLEQSYLPQPVAHIIDMISSLAGVLIFLLAGAYLIVPADLLPEGLIGPIGYLDDIVLLALGSIPVGTQIVGKFKSVVGRRR